MVEPLILIAGAAAAYFLTKKEEPLPEEPPLPVALPTVALPTVAVEPGLPPVPTDVKEPEPTPPHLRLVETGSCVRVQRGMYRWAWGPAATPPSEEYRAEQERILDLQYQQRLQGYKDKGYTLHWASVTLTNIAYACPPGVTEGLPLEFQALVPVGAPLARAYLLEMKEILSAYEGVHPSPVKYYEATAAMQVVIKMAYSDYQAGRIRYDDNKALERVWKSLTERFGASIGPPPIPTP